MEASPHFVRAGLTSGAELNRLAAAFAAVAADETISVARKPGCRRLGHARLADRGRPVTLETMTPPQDSDGPVLTFCERRKASANFLLQCRSLLLARLCRLLQRSKSSAI